MDRLLDLPVYWINLDHDTDRADNFMATTAAHFPFPSLLTRISGFDGRGISDKVVRDFLNSRREYAGKPPIEGAIPARTDKLTRGTYGCLQSHIAALQRGLNDGHERFLVMEDDAAFRPSLLERTPEPPVEAEFIGWGGLIMLGFKSDDSNYRAGIPNDWVSLYSKSRFYGTHAYEVHYRAAETLLAIYQEAYISVDDAWHTLFDEVVSARPRIQIFTQLAGLTSAINGRARETGLI